MPDYFFKRINHSVFYNIKNFYKPTILSVEKEDSSYIIKTLFANGEKDNYFSRVSAIINVEVVKEYGKWRLMSMLDRNLQTYYKSEQIGSIHYYYPRDRGLNKTLGFRFDSLNTELARKFNTSPIFVTYYLCYDNKSVQRLKGFEFEFSMAFPQQISGLADMFNNTIYSGNNSEWYPHELIHLYANKVYGYSINDIFNEGVATYLGGSLGKPLEYHLHKIANYIIKHPVNFNNLSSLDRVDDETNFQYSIGGLLCKIVDAKVGFSGVKKLLETGNTDEEFFRAIESVIKVKSIDFNDFIHKELMKYGD